MRRLTEYERQIQAEILMGFYEPVIHPDRREAAQAALAEAYQRIYEAAGDSRAECSRLLREVMAPFIMDNSGNQA